jgi:hypothetical protein
MSRPSYSCRGSQSGFGHYSLIDPVEHRTMWFLKGIWAIWRASWSSCWVYHPFGCKTKPAPLPVQWSYAMTLMAVIYYSSWYSVGRLVNVIIVATTLLLLLNEEWEGTCRTNSFFHVPTPTDVSSYNSSMRPTIWFHSWGCHELGPMLIKACISSKIHCNDCCIAHIMTHAGVGPLINEMFTPR